MCVCVCVCVYHLETKSLLFVLLNSIYFSICALVPLCLSVRTQPHSPVCTHVHECFTTFTHTHTHARAHTHLTEGYQPKVFYCVFLPHLNHLVIVKTTTGTGAEWLVENLQLCALDMVKYTRV